MKVFKDLVFKEGVFGGIGTSMKFDNGFKISVQAGSFAYSSPRRNSDSPDDFDMFEVAVFRPNGKFTREFFPKDHNDDVMGWQSRGQINALMLLVQNHG